MSLTTIEREAVQANILINPSTITISRPSVSVNARGISVIDWSSPSSVPLVNPVRVSLNNKLGIKIINSQQTYQNEKVWVILTDYLSEIKKHDRFTLDSKTYEIQDVTPIKIEGNIKNYQAELKRVDETNV